MLPHSFNTVLNSNAYFVAELFKIKNSNIEKEKFLTNFIFKNLHEPAFEAIITYFLINKIKNKGYDFVSFKKEFQCNTELATYSIIESVKSKFDKKFNRTTKRIYLLKNLLLKTITNIENNRKSYSHEHLANEYEKLMNINFSLQNIESYAVQNFSIDKWNLNNLQDNLRNYENLLSGIEFKDSLTVFLIENSNDITQFLNFIENIYQEIYSHKVNLEEKINDLIKRKNIKKLGELVANTIVENDFRSLFLMVERENGEKAGILKSIKQYENKISNSKIFLKKILKVFVINKVPVSEKLKSSFEIIIKNQKSYQQDYIDYLKRLEEKEVNYE